MKRKFLRLCAVFMTGTLMTAVLCFTGPALAGQTVVINGEADDSYDNVYGNGPDANGTLSDNDYGRLLDPNGNTVIVNGGMMSNIYGGYTTVGTANNNTVTISGSPTLSDSNLYGGFLFMPVRAVTDVFAGNTLNVWDYTGSPVASVNNFQYYNFVLPDASWAGLSLSAGGMAYLNNYDPDHADPATIGSTVTGVSVVGGATPVKPGDSVTLIDASTGTLHTDSFEQPEATGQHGAVLLYDWINLDATATTLTATLDSVGLDPRTKVLSEGFISGLALLNQGADLTAGAGLENAISAANGYGSFAALSGGWSRYNTGSHSDLAGVSMMAGLARGLDISWGRAAYGAFVEYGSGGYDTNNSFNGVGVDGSGDADYLGGGVLGRLDFNGTGAELPHIGRPYIEGSARAGRVNNDYDSGLFDAMNRRADFDASSSYFGLHLGAGYVRSLSERSSLDLYGKYFWTRLGGDSVTMSTGDPVTFDDADSHRLRFGGRYKYGVSERVSAYFGAAWEHEFGGEAAASTYGYSIDAPSLEGGTGIGEIGLTVKPSPDKPLTMDLGVQGYAGAHEGVTGSLRVKWAF